MFDVEILNEVENTFAIKRFAALPRVNEAVIIDMGNGLRPYSIIKVWFEESPDQPQLWTPHVKVVAEVNL